MGKQKIQTERTERRRRNRSGEAAVEKLSRWDKRENEREKRGAPKYTLSDCMRFGLIANILFVVFILICLIYYYTIGIKGKYSIPFEVVAYTIESVAFVLFSISAVWLDHLVRARRGMKFLLIFYIIVEVMLMLLEFNFVPFVEYPGVSLPLMILHVIFSAGVSLSMLMLDPQNKRLQIIVTITTTIILAGMFLGLAGYRIYASVLLNAVAFIFFYAAAYRQLIEGEISVDCYGDRAGETAFSSTMFADTPTMIEIPESEKPQTLSQKAKRVVSKLTPADEKIVLTDDDEKFEYEFGADADDDEDGEDA